MTRHSMTRSRKTLAFVVGTVSYSAGLTLSLAQDGSGPVVISQFDRAYSPEAVVIERGESIRVINDDLFVHNAFIDHPDAEFDSGVMEEGGVRDVAFDRPGEYQLKCAIHPKMNLDITVR